MNRYELNNKDDGLEERNKRKTRVMALRSHLSSREIFGTLIQLINMGGEGLEVWDDELLAEGLSEQDNVALDTPDE